MHSTSPPRCCPAVVILSSIVLAVCAFTPDTVARDAHDSPVNGSEVLFENTEGIELLPTRVILHGAGAKQRIVVERVAGHTYLGPIKGNIRLESSDPKVVTIDADGHLAAIRPGRATIIATCGSTQTETSVEVTGTSGKPKWEFTRHVLPVLSKSGCNSGACHGALAGKGGFKLSLRGYNPSADHFTITRQMNGRRVEPTAPGKSLLLAKPSMTLPHKGGVRLPEDSPDYRLLAEWIANGAPATMKGDATLKHLEVLPNGVSLAVGDSQPLIVRAHYSDGRQEDVTDWARFSATNESVAKVDESGEVVIVGHGGGAIVVWFSSQIALCRVTVPYAQHLDVNRMNAVPRSNFIDELVFRQLRRLQVEVSPRSGDTEFLRRVYLDTIGTLPSVDETEEFIASNREDKRDRLIDELLTRTEFVDFWSHKWSDVLLVSGRRLRPLAVKSYYSWIRNHVRDNTPWDQMVREIITATGETGTNGATNFYSLHQSPEEMTENTCQAFLSLSIGCAKCHNHPLEKWTNDQYYAMASHFARVRAKGWGGDARGGDGVRTLFLADTGELMQPTKGEPQPPTTLDGNSIPFDAPGDRRIHLANWVTADDNPYFSRAIANRIWANFLGVGLVNPIDDLRISNPATNEPLLDALSQYVTDHDYDLKMLMRTILQSETYQRTSVPIPENQDEQHFYSHYYPRRLSAEVLLDAISQVTGIPTEFNQLSYDGADFQATEEYPLGTRAIQLADSAVVSNFLKTFGRNDRDITCECERSNTPSIVQVLHLNNGLTINDRLASNQSWVANTKDQSIESIVHEAYKRALSRPPSTNELQQLRNVFTKDLADNESAEELARRRRTLVEDLYWSILSSREFLFNH